MRPYYLLFLLFPLSFIGQGVAQQSSADYQKQLDSLQKLESHIASMLQDLQAERENITHQILVLQQQNQKPDQEVTLGREALVTGNGGVMRKGPNIESESVSFIPSGSLVLVYDFYHGSFFRIEYDGNKGYLDEAALQQSEELLTIKQHWQRKETSKTTVTTVAKAPGKTVEKSHSYPTRAYITGPRGGCYYINSAGNKTYVDRSFCGGSNNPVKTYSGRTYYKGSRGGCYYINSSGNKAYVARSMCD